MSRWVKPKPTTPQRELQLVSPRGKFTPLIKLATDTSRDSAESVGLTRGGYAVPTIGNLADAMVDVLERHSRKVKLGGVMLGLTVRKEVLDYLRAHPEGATADEIADAIDRSQFTTRPRVSELNKMNAIIDSGGRRPNATSGRPAIVWIVTQQELV
ncbi:MAG: hypothetical protein WBQ86_09540 [Candidatus Binatus sp.]